MAPTRMSEADVLKALNHPVRRQVMLALDDGVASSKELAALIGLPIPNISYHVGILRDLGLIRVVRETPRRGAVERHYQATARTITVRHAIDWLLVADETRSGGWTARIIDLDSEGAEAADAALERLWKDLEKIETQVARRSGRTGASELQRHALGTFATPIAGVESR